MTKTLADIRERIIEKAEQQFNMEDEYDPGIQRIALAAAREMAILIRERYRPQHMDDCAWYQCECGHPRVHHFDHGSCFATIYAGNSVTTCQCRSIRRRVCSCGLDDLVALLAVGGRAELESKDSCAGLIHQIASPLAETEPRPISELIEFCEQQEAEARKWHHSRIDSANCDIGMSKADLEDAHRIAEAMSGEKLPRQTKAERERSRQIELRIAAKYLREAETFKAITAVLRQIGSVPPSLSEASPDTAPHLPCGCAGTRCKHDIRQEIAQHSSPVLADERETLTKWIEALMGTADGLDDETRKDLDHAGAAIASFVAEHPRLKNPLLTDVNVYRDLCARIAAQIGRRVAQARHDQAGSHGTPPVSESEPAGTERSAEQETNKLVYSGELGYVLQPDPLPEGGAVEPMKARSVEWGLANVYMLARRRLRALPDGDSEREWWQHIQRIAEESGVRQHGVLRHSVPTELTDGSPSSPGEPTT